MKVSIAMKSTYAYERLITSSNKKEPRHKIEFHPENIKNRHRLDNVIEFWKPDLLVIDAKLHEFDNMINMANQYDVPFIVFDSEFELVVQQLINMVSLKTNDESDEDEYQRQVEYIKSENQKEIIYKDRIIEKEIFRTSYKAIPNKLIVVASMWHSVGSTIFATNLARAISSRGVEVSYVEFPLLKPYMFDYLSIPYKEEDNNKAYIDLAYELKKHSFIKNRSGGWLDYNINWYVNDSRNEQIKSFTYEEMLKLIYSINSTVTILDVSAYLHNQDVQKFLHHADDIYVCVEADPIKTDWLSTIYQDGVIGSHKQRREKKVIDYLTSIEEKEGIEYQFINTKYTKKVPNKDFWEMLNKKPLCFFPTINNEVILDSIWQAKILYDFDEIYKEEIEKALKPIITRVVPKDYMNLSNDQNSKSKGNFNNIFKVFKKGEKQ